MLCMHKAHIYVLISCDVFASWWLPKALHGTWESNSNSRNCCVNLVFGWWCIKAFSVNNFKSNDFSEMHLNSYNFVGVRIPITVSNTNLVNLLTVEGFQPLYTFLVRFRYDTFHLNSFHSHFVTFSWLSMTNNRYSHIFMKIYRFHNYLFVFSLFLLIFLFL